MEKETIVIASNDVDKMLYVVAKAAVNVDRIEMHYMSKYSPTVEYLLRILRKGFGWLEVDRGTSEVTNTKCKFNVMGLCKHDIHKGNNIRCIESVRINCKAYTPRDNNVFNVNTITIDKVGAIRGL